MNADINHKRQAFNDLEAHIIQIRARKGEEEEYYQSLKNVLYEPLDSEFEYGYKERNLFSEESGPTGRVILKEKDYKTLKERADFGKKIKPKYRELIKGEKVQSLEETVLDQRGEINGNRKKLNAAYKKFGRLTKEKDNCKPAYEDEQTKHENARKFVKAVYHLGRDILGDKSHRRIINKIDDNINPEYRKAFGNMVTLDREVMVMFRQKDEKSRKHIAFGDGAMIRTKQEKDKDFDLEL